MPLKKSVMPQTLQVFNKAKNKVSGAADAKLLRQRACRLTSLRFNVVAENAAILRPGHSLQAKTRLTILNKGT